MLVNFYSFSAQYCQRLAVLITIFVLSACSALTDKPAPEPLLVSNDHQTNIAQLTKWRVTGKIGFITPQQRQRANLSWQMNESIGQQQLNLSTYLGINVLKVSSMSGEHQIEVDGKLYRGQNLSDLITQLTGLNLPAEALAFWLKGIPYRYQDIVSYQADNQLAESISSAINGKVWQIRYQAYREFNGYVLPTKMTIEQGELTIKISLNQWQV